MCLVIFFVSMLLFCNKLPFSLLCYGLSLSKKYIYPVDIVKLWRPSRHNKLILNSDFVAFSCMKTFMILTVLELKKHCTNALSNYESHYETLL